MTNYRRLEIIDRENSRISSIETTLFQEFKTDFSVFQRKFYLLNTNAQNIELFFSTFFDPILEMVILQDDQGLMNCDWVVEVSFLPGVTDNAGRSAQNALLEQGIVAEVASGTLYYISGKISEGALQDFVKEHLANPLIQKISLFDREQWSARKRFENIQFPKVKLNHDSKINQIDIYISDEEAEKYIAEKCLALSMDEWHFIQEHYSNPDVQNERKRLGLSSLPTDVEIEIIAQSWSEHCKHKIFSSDIDFEYRDTITGEIRKQKIQSLYKSFIKKATFDAKERYKISWLISVFSDNAGIVRFDPKVDLCIKVETHNSPSALDPYGGALTGILGVNRDIMGTGMGARPIANTDVFCFGSPSLPFKGMENLMPDGPKSPRNIFRGVHRGIEDGGNKSGIPTVNGSIFFDDSYCGKPLVFCGTVGVMPQYLNDKKSASTKHARPGDRVVVIGGAVGADGIHGATFSSLELDENSPATAVQIGDPLTQRRCLDFLLEAREQCLYSSITDNGAGGISSSIGEMARETGGAKIDLSRCTLKYPGLSPWEIMISESQERMSLAVPNENLQAFLSLAKERGVDAQVLGEFTDNGRFEIYFKEQLIGNLSLKWLHDDLPPMKLKAYWDGPRLKKSWYPKHNQSQVENLDLSKVVNKVLASDNVASKEKWVRYYDHEVQGATHIKPFMTDKKTSPSNCGAIWLYPHGGERDSAVFIGHGLAPRLSQFDPYLMAQISVDEAVRNIVAQGADPEKICLLDNFCWPDPVASAKNPEGEYKLGQLVRSCQGLYDIAVQYGLPFVSGKDSMKNDFRGKNKAGEALQISVLPTLLVTSMGHGKIGATIGSAFTQASLCVGLIGRPQAALLATEFSEHFALTEELKVLPSIDLELNRRLYLKLHQAIKSHLIESCSDISEGGLVTTLCEMTFMKDLGLKLDISSELPLHAFLFNEAPGQFVVGFHSPQLASLKNLFGDSFKLLGETTQTHSLELKFNQNNYSLDLQDCYKAWNKDWSEVNS
ncbi:MAG: AIR synthase-related protein [Bdellovibrio sp.]